MTASPHRRHTAAMLASPRCGAKTRPGPPCRAPAVRGRARCRKHGCAKGAGAPAGNRNALKHGFYSRKAIAARRALREVLHNAKLVLGEVTGTCRHGERSGTRNPGGPDRRPGSQPARACRPRRGGRRRRARAPPV